MVMRRRRRKRAHTNHQHLMWRSCCRLPNQVVHWQQGCPGEEFRKLITPSEDPWLLGSVEAGWSSDDGTLLVEKGKDTKHVKRLIHSPVNRLGIQLRLRIQGLLWKRNHVTMNWDQLLWSLPLSIASPRIVYSLWSECDAGSSFVNASKCDNEVARST